MDISQLNQVLPAVLLRGRAIHLTGAPGTGKNHFIEKVLPRTLEKITGEQYVTVVIEMTCQDQSTVKGFQFPMKTEVDGKPVVRTVGSVPEIVDMVRRVARGTGRKVILFLDELSQSSVETQKAVAPLQQYGRVAGHKLPEGTLRIAASNRLSDRSGVNRPPMNLVNKQLHIELESTVASWRDDYAIPNGVHPLAIQYLVDRPGMIKDTVPDTPTPYCTFRSFTEGMADVQAIAGEEAMFSGAMHEDALLAEVLAGSIGQAAASDVLTYMKMAKHMVRWDDIMAAPTQVKIPDVPQKISIAWAYAGMVVHHIKPETAKKCFEFVTNVLPKEMQVSCLKTCCEKYGGVIANTPEFQEWAAKRNVLIRETLTL